MNKLSPTVDELNALRRDAPSGPIVMINLLKFQPETGAKTYRDYIEAASRAAQIVGTNMDVRYLGVAGPDVAGGEDWDFVAIVEYASVHEYVNLMMHPIYQNEAIPIRPRALSKTLFMASFPATIAAIAEDNATFSRLSQEEPDRSTQGVSTEKTKLSPTTDDMDAALGKGPTGPVMVLNLLKFKPNGGRETYLRYWKISSGAFPPGVAVRYTGKAGTDVAGGQIWDFVILVEYPSLAALHAAATSATFSEQAEPLRHDALEKTIALISYPSAMDVLLLS